MKYRLERIILPLKINWKLSRNETLVKENFIVRLIFEGRSFFSEVAPNVRYNETSKKIEKEFALFSLDKLDLKLLQQKMGRISCPSLRFALESVSLKALAYKKHQSLSELLELNKLDHAGVETSMSMPILPSLEVKNYLLPLKRFQRIKVKVNKKNALNILQKVSEIGIKKVIVDANESWLSLDEYLGFEKNILNLDFEEVLIEQPFPSFMSEEYKTLKSQTQFKIIGDESILSEVDFHEIQQQFHVVNIKLMKAGSLFKAKELIERSHLFGLETMLGCMIETSLGISYGMLFSSHVHYVDLDGFLLLQKDPFQMVEERGGRLYLNEQNDPTHKTDVDFSKA